MTVEVAIASTRAKWSHAPVDVHDIEERLAMRQVDAEVVLHGPQPHCPAARLFVRHGDRWRSAYVHRAQDTDEALDRCMRGR